VLQCNHVLVIGDDIDEVRLERAPAELFVSRLTFAKTREPSGL
jgi:hypothetical protein